MEAELRLLGLDPGSRLLGYGVIESTREGGVALIESGTLKLDPKATLSTRLKLAHEHARELIVRLKPERVVIEECFVAQGVRAALVLGQVRGVLMLAAELEQVPLAEFAPRAIKLATVGNGGAAKEQVQYMIPRLVRGCPEKMGPDEADAIAIAWCGLQHARSRVA